MIIKYECKNGIIVELTRGHKRWSATARRNEHPIAAAGGDHAGTALARLPSSCAVGLPIRELASLADLVVQIAPGGTDRCWELDGV